MTRPLTAEKREAELLIASKDAAKSKRTATLEAVLALHEAQPVVLRVAVG